MSVTVVPVEGMFNSVSTVWGGEAIADLADDSALSVEKWRKE